MFLSCRSFSAAQTLLKVGCLTAFSTLMKRKPCLSPTDLCLSSGKLWVLYQEPWGNPPDSVDSLFKELLKTVIFVFKGAGQVTFDSFPYLEATLRSPQASRAVSSIWGGVSSPLKACFVFKNQLNCFFYPNYKL